MADSTRYRAKRKLKESRNNITWAGAHLFAIAEEYRKLHPEISNELDFVLNLLLEVDNMIIKIDVMI